MQVIIDKRFHGPDGSGNGGYVAGLLAEHVASDTVTVALRRPPPLDTGLRVSDDGERGRAVRLWDGEHLVAEGLAAAIVVPPVPAVTHDEALRATAGYLGAGDGHPFPRCVVCGPARDPGDGLRLAPGPVGTGTAGAGTAGTGAAGAGTAGTGAAGAGTVAAVWTPAEAPGRELLWAAMDCPGAWSFDPVDRPSVLGTMTAQVNGLPEAGEPCVVMGRARSREGRKTHTATALYGADGRLLGRAEQIWIEIDKERFGAVA